jgi:hypothetical protein
MVMAVNDVFEPEESGKGSGGILKPFGIQIEAASEDEDAQSSDRGKGVDHQPWNQ